MTKKISFAALAVLLLMFHAPAIHAADYYWDFINALVKNDYKTVEGILTKNVKEMTAPERKLAVNFVLIYTRDENTLAMLELLGVYNIHTSVFDLYTAINRAHSDRVVQFILNERVRPNGEILLLAFEKKRLNWAKQFISLGADVNYRYPPDRPYADGMTPLMYAARWENFELVKLLVERGANVNLQAKDGSTALSIALAGGQMAICNYLSEQGAVDYVANQIPANAGPAKKDAAGEVGIASIVNKPSFSIGTYRLNGNTTEIKFTGDVNLGTITIKNNQGKTSGGFFQISGNNLTVMADRQTVIYKIDSARSFSGNGETWVRVGD